MIATSGGGPEPNTNEPVEKIVDATDQVKGGEHADLRRRNGGLHSVTAGPAQTVHDLKAGRYSHPPTQPRDNRWLRSSAGG